MIDVAIKKLVEYGVETGLLQETDRCYTVNQILSVLKLDEYKKPLETYEHLDLESILEELLDYACDKGLIQDCVTDRDLFDTKLMNCLMPRPSEVNSTFWDIYKQQSPRSATDFYYKFSQDSNYIRRYRIKKDVKWVTPTEYGNLDITINLSKPEKDPKAIAAAKLLKQSGYPKCQLCMENEGYIGRENYSARNNHRILRLNMNGNLWGFQYSPYVYYKEHCIVFRGEHTPMRIEGSTFVKLFDFVKQFPHYILGSNADLPIVGGSILSHNHFQGGNYEFPMATAPVETYFCIDGFEEVQAGIVRWPMSVLRLRSKQADLLIALGTKVLKAWRGYSDEDSFVFAETEGQPHNTITPIARMRNGAYELDLVLRNNITTKKHPYGLYHPHENLHHIKKENIGLIEVMGLAVLPSRLKEELNLLADYLVEEKEVRTNETIKKHGDWVDYLRSKYHTFHRDSIDQILKKEVGLVFKQVLEDAGVFKCDETGRAGFYRFLLKMGFAFVSQ